jgi:hypothetical protein
VVCKRNMRSYHSQINSVLCVNNMNAKLIKLNLLLFVLSIAVVGGNSKLNYDSTVTFLRNNTIWIKSNSYSIEKVSKKANEEFIGIFVNPNDTNNLLLFFNRIYRIDRNISTLAGPKEIQGKLKNKFNDYLIISKGMNKLWAIRNHYIKQEKDTIYLTKSRKLNSPLELNSMFVPNYIELYENFKTQYSDSIVVFETDELDTLILIKKRK